MSFHNHDADDPQGFIRGRNAQIKKEKEAKQPASDPSTQEEQEQLAKRIVRKITMSYQIPEQDVIWLMENFEIKRKNLKS